MDSIIPIAPIDGSESDPLQRWPCMDIQRNASNDEPASSWNNLVRSGDDRSLPRPIFFAWEPLDGRHSDGYRFILAQDNALTAIVEDRETHEPEVTIWHLHVGTDYYWQVQAYADGRCIAESAITSFRTHASLPRWISAPEATNIRDIGGWPLAGRRRVRQGLAYRSSALNCHLELTATGEDVILNHLGVRTDLDLRGHVETASPTFDTEVVQWINVPIMPYHYITRPECTAAYRTVFRVFADPANYPILFHCWGGADRAGTVAFLLNAMLGVDERYLVHDYELTSLSIWGVRSRHSDDFSRFRNALEAFGEKYDSVNFKVIRYLNSIGIKDREMTQIRQILVGK